MAAAVLNQDTLIEIMSYLDVRPRFTWGLKPNRKPSLCACALTCRDWLGPAKAHLYRTTDFYIDDGLQITGSISTLVDLLLAIERSGSYIAEIMWWSIPNLTSQQENDGRMSPGHQVASSRETPNPENKKDMDPFSPQILKQIMELTDIHNISHTFLLSQFSHETSQHCLVALLNHIDGRHLRDHIHRLVWKFHNDNMDHTDIMLQLPALRELRIWGLSNIWNLSQCEQIAQSIVVHQIVLLELTYGQFDSPVELCYFLAAFTALESLVLRFNLMTSDSTAGTMTREVPAPPLRRLQLSHHHDIPRCRGNPLQCVLHWLSLSNTVMNIQDIDLTYCHWDVSLWIEVNGPLFVGLKRLSFWYDTGSSINLSSCIIMECLEIRFTDAWSFHALLATLRSIRSECMQVIRINYFPYPANPGIDEWDLLYPILTQPKLMRLIEVSISISLLQLDPDEATILASKFKQDMDRFRGIRGFRCTVQLPVPNTGRYAMFLGWLN